MIRDKIRTLKHNETGKHLTWPIHTGIFYIKHYSSKLSRRVWNM